MILIAYLIFFVPYLLLSIFIVRLVMKWARKRGRRAGLWGFITGFIMYNLVFWDFLPTLIAHKYYCATECRFEVYKTAEQWREENPDAVVGPIKMPEGMELDAQGNGALYQADGTKLRYFNGNKKTDRMLIFENPDGSQGYWLNDRFFVWQQKNKIPLLSTVISYEYLIDSDRKEKISKNVTVHSGYREGDWRVVRIWLNISSCYTSFTSNKSLKDEVNFFYNLGDEK